MRRLLLILITLTLFAAPFFGSTARGATTDVIPRIIDLAPLGGEELAPDGSVVFYFNTPMDQASVQAALTVQSASGAQQNLTGSWSWQAEKTATFKPAQPLRRGQDYVFSLKAGAKSKAGQPLLAGTSYRIRTAGLLDVAQLIPATGTQDVDADAVITVIFNRPVVPVTTLDPQANLPNPLTIAPAVTGKGQWVNTSTYQFKPDAPLAGGTTYAVTVKKGLADATGSQLAADVTTAFVTASPRVIEVIPADKAQNAARDVKVTLSFSQPMSRAATESAISLTGPNGAQVSGAFEWRADNKSVTFTPGKLLDYGTLYDITVNNTLAKAATGAPISAAAKGSFTVSAAPEITNVRPGNNVTTSKTDLEIIFNQPMKLDDFEKRVTITPKPPKVDYTVDEYNSRSFTVLLSVEDNTTYTAVIDPAGLTDSYGTQLRTSNSSKFYTLLPDGKIQVRFTIKLNFPTVANLQTAGPVGLYNAYNPTTRVYSTHRNVGRLDLQLYGLDPMQATEFLRNYPNDALKKFAPPASQILRNWQVPVENPAQVLRYDLLTISANGTSAPAASSAFTCPGAPAARLQTGSNATVLRDPPSSSNLRANPNRSANVVARLPPGTAFVVQDGPRCADGFVWYRTTYNNLTGWLAEGQGTQYFVGPADGAAATTPTVAAPPAALPGTGKEPLKPGAYLLRFSSPDIKPPEGAKPEDFGPLSHIMIVATANITIKMTTMGATAWVTDLQSGQPVAGASVLFMLSQVQYGADGFKETPFATVGKAQTDASGIATITMPSVENLYNATLAAVIDDGKTFALASSSQSNGIEPYNFNLTSDYNVNDAAVYLYSDRSLYRPGQPVYFKGVLRTKTDVTYGLNADMKTIPVEVLNDAGESIYKADVPLTGFGTFSGQFTLSDQAALGTYRIVARLPNPFGRAEDNREPTRDFERAILIAQYRAPEFKVDLVPKAPAVVRGEPIRVEVDASYFSGGALNNVPVAWTVTGQDYSFEYKGRGNYTFIDYNEDAGPSAENNEFGSELASGKGRTDASGKFIIEFPADPGKTQNSKNLIIEAQITDESGQSVSGRALVTVHAGELYLGAAPEEYVVQAGKQAAVGVVAVDWESNPLANIEVSARAVERNWKSVKQVDPTSGKTVWTYEVQENPIESAGIKTDKDGKARFVFTPPRGGTYKVYVTTRDSKGNQVTSAAYVYVAGPDFIPWRQRNNYGIDVKTDKLNYQIGDTAEILIASPFQGAAKAWITVERGGILKSEVIDLPTNSTIYRLPIDATFAPNAFVSVTLVKGTDDKNPIPAFRIGYAAINVNPDQFKLNIEIKPDKEKAGPREQVTYTLRVTDSAGKPVKAELGVGLTDLAVLSLLPDTSKPIMQAFYEPQSLAVLTANALTISVDEQTQTILNTVKGGGGGGPEGGVMQIRQLFIDTPLWNPTVTTDDNGMATVSVTLPDNLTTWRLDARAVTLPTGALKTTLVGQVTSDLISTKPLLVRPLTPRFFVAGDSATLGATINNNTGVDQEVTVSLALTGATLAGPGQIKLTVKNGERGRADFPITVNSDVSGVDAVFSASSADGKFSDSAKPVVGNQKDRAIPVYRYAAPETVSTSGVIGKEGGDRTEGVVLPERLNITQGSLDLRVDASLSAAAFAALKALDNSPYTCTEGTASILFANAATRRAFDAAKLTGADLKANLDEQVNIALQTLGSQQHIDGGWGWCFRDNSTAQVTAYTLLALVQAKASGYSFDASLTQKAITFLNTSLTQPADQSQQWVLNRQAFALYALAKAGAGNVSRTVGLFAIRERMSIYARALLLSTFRIVTPNDSAKINTLVSDLQTSAITSASGQHWEERTPDRINWNTDTRTTAIVLAALTEAQPQNALLPQIVRWLMYARSSDAWETTQETAWSVYALTNWPALSGDLNPAYQFSATINDKPLVAATNTTGSADALKTVVQSVPVTDLLKGDTNRLTLTRTAGDGTLYYTASLTAYVPVDKVQPANRGLTIARSYSLLADKARKLITGAKVGDDIRVTITLVVPEDMSNVIVTDPIPAGTEALNPDLATTGGIGVAPELNLADPLGNGYGWWWFGNTQLRDEKTVLSAEYLPAGTYTYTYTVRAGLAGQYQVIPATAQQQYFPDVYGRTAGALFTITP